MIVHRTLGFVLVALLSAAHTPILADGAHEVLVPCPGIRTGTFVPNCPCTSSALEFQGIASDYARLLDVKVVAKNNSKGTIYIDPSQAGIPLLFRWNEAHSSWDEVETWRCSNVGQGTKRLLSPGATIQLDVRNSSAVVDLSQGLSVILFDDAELSTAGRYRLGLRVSTEFWPALVDIVSGKKFTSCTLQLSAPFVVSQ